MKGERRSWYCFSHCSIRNTAPVLGNSIEVILYVELEIEVLEEQRSQTGNCETRQRLTTAKSSHNPKGLNDRVMQRYRQVSEASHCGGNLKQDRAYSEWTMLFHRTWSHVPSLEVSVRNATQRGVGRGWWRGGEQFPFLPSSNLPPVPPTGQTWRETRDKGSWEK